MSNLPCELIVECDEPLSIVEIADGRYRLIDQAPRRVAKALAPGLYVARVKYDERVEERLVDHGEQVTRVLFGPDAAELSASRREREFVAKQRQMSEVRSQGLRTWITVSVKSPGLGTLPTSDRLSLPDWSAFTVSALDGQPLAPGALNPALTSPDQADSEHDHILSKGLAVGWYSLRIPARDGSAVFLPLYVSARFSPTVLLEVGGVRDNEAWFDFDRLVVSYDELEGDAYADPLRLKALRAARRSLELGRNGLTGELMDVLYQQKFQDPMLGLFALQLLLLNAKSGLGATASPVRQFNEVMDNMTAAFNLPQHPDLVLARAQARRLKWPVPDKAGDREPLVAPPLLRANWNALVSMSARRSEVVGVDRPLRQVSEGLLQSGIWVMWKPPTRPTAEGAQAFNLKFTESPVALAHEELVYLPGLAALASASAPREPMGAASVGSARPSRAVDAQLEEVVDQIRAQVSLRVALQKRLQADPPTSTVLERAVCRAALQLADVETKSARNVPVGFAKRLASDLAVPYALVGDTVKRMRKEVRAWRPEALENPYTRSFLP